MNNLPRFTITEAAEILDITPKTLTRWEKAGKIHTVKRDYRGWRVYLQDDLDKISDFINTLTATEK